MRDNEIDARIGIYYVNNYDFNKEFSNELSYKDFLKWKSSTAISLLIKYGFMIHIFPFTSYKVECDAYNPWSVKFFADGSLGVCNATHYNKRILERSSTNTDAEYVQKILSPYKNNISKNNNQCLNCSLIGICRGKIYCDNGLCNPMNNVDFDIFIKEYVEQLNNNNGKYFTFLGTN